MDDQTNLSKYLSQHLPHYQGRVRIFCVLCLDFMNLDFVGGQAPCGAFVRATTLGRPYNTRLPPMRGYTPQRPERHSQEIVLNLGCFFEQFDIEAERLQFLDENVEGLGETRFEREVTLDDGFVHARTTEDVIGFDREEFLQ